ncbi:MAG TPA: hypothetical protein VJL87_07300 [Bdellovibrionota bacterium]|nr:hypothetical protein [Bdellovibrionota bacterium]
MKRSILTLSLITLVGLGSSCGNDKKDGQGPGNNPFGGVPVVCSGNPIQLNLSGVQQFPLSEMVLPYGDYQYEGTDIYVIQDDRQGHISELQIREDAGGTSWNSSVVCESSNAHQRGYFNLTFWALHSMRLTPDRNNVFSTRSYHLRRNDPFYYNGYNQDNQQYGINQPNYYGSNYNNSGYYNNGLNGNYSGNPNQPVNQPYNGYNGVNQPTQTTPQPVSWDFSQEHIHNYTHLYTALREITPPMGYSLSERFYQTTADHFEYRTRMIGYSYDGVTEVFVAIRFVFTPIY